MPPDPVGVSREVITHHAGLHRQRCRSDGVLTSWCPCGDTFALCCGTCRCPVFVLCRPGWPMCLHALEALDTSHREWWGAAA